jgi:anti-sigma factor RsiW
MSDSNQHSTNADLPLAALIRLAADGEISAEQERRLEIELERDPDLARRVEAEQRLRSSVARAFESAPATPAGLRDRVAAAMASAELGDAAPLHKDSVPARMASVTRDRSFWAGPAARVLAAAAALTLVATVFVVSRSPAGDPAIGSRTRAVQFVASEHGRCVADIAPGLGKFRVDDAQDMPGLAGDVLGQEITLADLIAGGVQNVAFIDAGRCGVPGGGGSMHLRFEVPSDAGGEPDTFSLFVQQNTGSLELSEGVTYALDPSDGGTVDLKSPSIYVWLRGGLVYYLVVDNAKACGAIREHLAAPTDIEPLTNAA